MSGGHYKISFNSGILQARGVTEDGLRYYLDRLSKILNKRFLEVVPTTVFDTQSLDRILTLHEILSSIKDLPGANRHFCEYTQPQFSATLFVSRFASFLKGKVDRIELEPITLDGEGNPDIKIERRGVTAFIECKNIETSQFNNQEEHKNVFDLFEKHINVPHQISLSYKNTPTEDQVNTLGASVHKLLKSVTSTGSIINNDDYSVHVQIRDEYGDPRISGMMEMIVEEVNSGERVPGHVFLENGKTIAIQGPEIDYKKILQAKIRDARNQHVSGAIFITAINSDLMLGSTKNNIRCVEAMFQPNQNTRYSCIVLANNRSLIGEDRWQTISNPYAAVPMNSTIDEIFRKNA